MNTTQGLANSIQNDNELNVQGLCKIFSQLNQAYANVLLSAESKRFETLSNTLKNHNQIIKNIEQLMRQYANDAKSCSQLIQLENIIAGNQNDYLIHMINHDDTHKLYQSYIALLEPSQKLKWNKQYEQLINPPLSAKINDMVTYMLQGPVSWYRGFTPTTLQNFFDAYSPSTLDSTARTLILKLTAQSKKRLAKNLAQIKEKLSEHVTTLVQFAYPDTDNHQEAISQATQEFMEASKKDFEAFLKMNEAGINITQNLKHMVSTFQINTNKLILIQFLNQDIHTFINRYDGIMVKISNLLAQFIAFFKSSSARQIDELKSIQYNLKKIEHNYQLIQNDLSTHINKANVNQKFKDNCNRLLSDGGIQTIENSDHEKLKRNNRHGFFNDICDNYNQIIASEPTHANFHENSHSAVTKLVLF